MDEYGFEQMDNGLHQFFALLFGRSANMPEQIVL